MKAEIAFYRFPSLLAPHHTHTHACIQILTVHLPVLTQVAVSVLHPAPLLQTQTQIDCDRCAISQSFRHLQPTGVKEGKPEVGERMIGNREIRHFVIIIARGDLASACLCLPFLRWSDLPICSQPTQYHRKTF